MSQTALSDEGARAVYALLRLLGAPSSVESHFVQSFTEGSCPSEWRFQGGLGFGGKLYLESDRWRIGCYREDDTPERVERIADANVLLEVLRQKYGGGDTFERLQGHQWQEMPTHGSCRYCGHSNKTGASHCAACTRTLWDARGTERHEREIQERSASLEAVEQAESLIDASVNLGQRVEAVWTAKGARALRARARDISSESMCDEVFAGSTPDGAKWSVRLYPSWTLETPDHTSLYNSLAASVRQGDGESATRFAGALLKALEKSGSMYGWDRLPLLGQPEVDYLLKKLDRYLTGQRPAVLS